MFPSNPTKNLHLFEPPDVPGRVANVALPPLRTGKDCGRTWEHLMSILPTQSVSSSNTLQRTKVTYPTSRKKRKTSTHKCGKGKCYFPGRYLQTQLKPNDIIYQNHITTNHHQFFHPLQYSKHSGQNIFKTFRS